MSTQPKTILSNDNLLSSRLTTIVRQAVENAETMDDAIDAAMVRVMRSRPLSAFVVRVGVSDLVHDMMRTIRFSAGPRVMRAHAEQVRRALGVMGSWRLETGTLLRDATRVVLIQSAEILERTAAGVVARAVFYRRLAALLPDDTTIVGEAKIKDKALQPLLEDSGVMAKQIVATIAGAIGGE